MIEVGLNFYIYSALQLIKIWPEITEYGVLNFSTEFGIIS